ncbi:hypothetical protein [Prevotella sp. kh1p2]|uniref:hypothetical protein n=1 Tax=Prevotella sp. kh1p2 TaxID=1761883 RepID=UPI0015A724CF|nr:hypothetical protein [Prevotella sp. kh1p2]
MKNTRNPLLCLRAGASCTLQAKLHAVNERGPATLPACTRRDGAMGQGARTIASTSLKVPFKDVEA